MKLDTESWQTHKKQQFCRCCSPPLERFSHDFTFNESGRPRCQNQHASILCESIFAEEIG